VAILSSNPSWRANRVWRVTTPPAVEPVSVDELKTFLRLDGTSEDDLLTTFIKAARESAEPWLGRALIQQSLEFSMDWWPGQVVRLPRPPLLSVAGVFTVDEDGTETEYSADNYYLRPGVIPAELVIRDGYTQPSGAGRQSGGYVVRYTAGYGSAAGDVPAAIRTGLMFWAAKIYEDRVPYKDPPPEARAAIGNFVVMDRI